LIEGVKKTRDEQKQTPLFFITSLMIATSYELSFPRFFLYLPIAL